METIKKILVTLGLVLLCFAGCESDIIGTNDLQTDGIGLVSNEFLFTQEYGYCDTVCQAESVIIGDYVLPYALKSYVRYINTGDTINNGLPKTGFRFIYNTQNAVEVNFGNGVIKDYNGSGVDSMKYFCNTNYEMIITYK